MTKYEALLAILDAIRKEAPAAFKSYHAKSTEAQIQARSWAFIHLYLMAKCGVTSFSDRHKHITDGSGDGGIDGYFINEDTKQIVFIQSKFRATEKNFEEKEITLQELAKMEIDAVLEGEDFCPSGEPFSDKIKKMQKEIGELSGKYKYKVVLLANCLSRDKRAIKKLFENFEYEIFDFNRTYSELVFPVCAGDYFDPNEITIEVDTRSESKNEFYRYIKTSWDEASVRLIFVPASEIGRVVSKYKNALLRYNPRNFLSFSQNPVNAEIKAELLKTQFDDFALMNNGITFVANKDDYRDKSAKKGVGKLTLERPQIINGGQTAYTICKLYEEGRISLLAQKSVLCKIITPEEGKHVSPLMIEKVSASNNRQTRIVEADRRSNSSRLIEIQTHIFNSYGMFFERKKGEFWEGKNQGYIKKSDIIERVKFVRAFYAFQGNGARARTSQETIFEEELFSSILDAPNIDMMVLAYFALDNLRESSRGKGLVYSHLSAFGIMVDGDLITPENAIKVSKQIALVSNNWGKFEKFIRSKRKGSSYLLTGGISDKYYKASISDQDIAEFFKDLDHLVVY